MNFTFFLKYKKIIDINNIYLKILLIFFFSKVLYLFQYIFINKLIGNPIYPHLDMFLKWDSKIYLDIILNYYSPTINFPIKYPFFPVYPLLVKFISLLLHSNPIIIGIIINQLAFFISFILIYKYCKNFLHLPEKHVEFTLVLLSISSINIYINILYTESIFMLILLLAFYNLRNEKYWIAAIFGFILSATKIIGVLFVLPFFIYIYKKTKIINWQMIIQIFLISSGLLLFMLYLFKITGDPIKFVHVQVYWGRLNHVNWFEHPINSLKSIFQVARPHEVLFLILSIILMVFMFLKNYHLENIFFIVALILPILSGKLDSFSRFISVHFIIYIMFGYLTRLKTNFFSYFTIVFFSIFNFGLTFYLIKST
jgi:Gpi18-like mannosyltransferase